MLLGLLAPTSGSGWAENLGVLVVLSNSSAPYQSFATALKNNLPTTIHTTVLVHPGKLPADAPPMDLIIAVGMEATKRAAGQINTPVLAAMVPKMGYEELLGQLPAQQNARVMSAIYLNQPWNRQVSFLRAVLPDRRKVGLLHSPDTHIDITHLGKNVAKRGGSLIAHLVQSEEELFLGLESVLSNSDVLLAIPDDLIYNSSNIRNILLTSYHHRIPLIGISQPYVNAGALCAIFSTPEQLAVQTSVVAIKFLRTGQLPESQYPAEFTIAVNSQVARSMGIELPSQEIIRRQMDAAN